MNKEKTKIVALIIAHPDDETLWAGGTILSHPSWNWFIVCLCRKSDKERAAKFSMALEVLGAEGIMGDLDDGPGQIPLDQNMLQRVITDLLPRNNFDLLITHNPSGEYTRHIRHEDVSKAVIKLWQNGNIDINELWTFAYEDGNKKYYPRAVVIGADCYTLTQELWEKKYNIITEIYGFERSSWEAKTTPRTEAFFKFTDPMDLKLNAKISLI